MGIDIGTERLISIHEAAKMMPRGRNEKPAHVSTVIRWILYGYRGVKLEAIRCGVKWTTSVEALQRFLTRLNPSLENEPQAPRSPTARQRASQRAERELEGMGI
jgi:hypothetical protein